MRSFPLVLLVLAACDAGTRTAPSVAARDARVAAIASIDAGSTEVVVDSPDEKPRVQRTPDVRVTWLVSPAHQGPYELMYSPVTVEIATAKKTRRMKLEPQSGDLNAFAQALCEDDDDGLYRLQGDEVAKITFSGGGESGYVVRHTGTKLVLSAWQSDTCEDAQGAFAPCGAAEKAVLTMKAAADAVVGESIMLVDRRGARHPFDCDALEQQW